jgi:hypothetical protein
MLEQYIELHSRNFISGFYEGRWKMLPDTNKKHFHSWHDKNEKELGKNEK